MSDAKTLADLSEESGVPARTIRFYIARGLLDGPVKAGRGAVYTSQHLARIEKIKQLQNDGHMLAEIAHSLAGHDAALSGPAPTAWSQYEVDEGVMVWVRGDVSPWRMRQVRAAIEEMSGRLRSNERSKRK